MAFILLYLWNLFVVPAKLHAAAHNTIAELTRDDRKELEQARKELWELRAEGVKIRNDGLITRTVDSWTEKFEEWHRKMLEQAAILSLDLRHSLDPIDKISPTCNERVAINDPIHQKNVSVMSEMLTRLYNHLIK